MWQKIVKVSIYLLVFLLPLFWLSSSVEVFEFNKTYLLFFLVSIGFLAWLTGMIFKEKKIRFKKGPLDIFVLVFLLVMILNAVFSVDKTSSIFGFYGRIWPNLIGILSLGVFYFLVTNNVSPSNKGLSINGILKTFLWSSFFVVLISYFSLLGIWTKINSILVLPQVMLFKTFNPIGGSSAQLVMYLAIIFILLIAMLAFRKKSLDKPRTSSFRALKTSSIWLYVFLFAIFLLLILVDFWPAWLVISLSLLLFLIFGFWKRVFREDVNRLSLSILFLLISLIFLFTNPLQGFFQQTQTFSNLPREINLSQGMSWNVGFQGLKENIVFGSGNSTFNYLFAKFKPQSFLETPFWQIRFDRAGNHIAELLGTTGVLGILSFLALLGMFLMVSWIVIISKIKESSIKFQLPILLTFFGLLASQFVFYQNTTLAFSFWLFLALGAVSWDKPQKEKTFNFRDFPEIGLIFSILFWVALIGLGFFSFIMIKYYVADAYYRDYLVSPAENFEKIESSTRLNDSRATYHMTLARGYLVEISNEFTKVQPDNQLIINMTALAIREAQRAVEVSPKRVAVHQTLGIVYRDIQGLAQGVLEWGIKSFEDALELEPKNPVLMNELGKFKITEEKIEEAKVWFNKALELRGDYVEPGIQLALIDEEEGKKEEAGLRLEEIVKNNPFSVEAHFQLGRFYFNQKEYDKAIGQFQSAIIISPNHSNSHYSLGLTYEIKGLKDKALEEFEKVLALNPNNELVKTKIEELEREEVIEEEEEEEEEE